ncbi:MAG: YfhO family protein [Chitinivibrionales bacterium]|nr:YfhO family protein [Chitinivibrionales bacterium]
MAQSLQNTKASNNFIETIAAIVRRPWFPVVVFALLAILYFLPYLSFQKVIYGIDDGPRGWHAIGNTGYGNKSLFDRWNPLNGGLTMMEQRFGRFINPTHLFHMVLPMYKARTLEYLFWTFAAGLLCFLFLRELRISRKAAYLGAIVYMMAPAFQSLIVAGHFAKMSVIAMLPGLLFFTQRLLNGRRMWDLIGLVTVMSLSVYSNHPQIAIFAFMGMFAYYVCRMLYSTLVEKTVAIAEGLRRASVFAAALIAALLLTSMSLFPSYHDTTRTSKRAGGVDYSYAASFALHPEEMVNLVEPDFIGWGELYWGQNSLKLNSEYFGICTLLLMLMLFMFRRQGFTKYLFVGLFLFGIMFSLGPHTPVHKFFYTFFPPIKSLRGPSMMYIWFFLPAVALAAYSLDEIFTFDWKSNVVVRKKIIIFSAIAGGLCLLYMLATGPFIQFWYANLLPAAAQHQQKASILPQIIKSAQNGGLAIFLIVGAFFTLCYLVMGRKIGHTTFFFLVAALMLIDLVRISRPFLAKATYPNNFYLRNEQIERSIGDYLRKKDSSIYRVHHLLQDQRLVIPGLELTYTFNDFTNKRYNSLIRALQEDFYSVFQNNPDGESVQSIQQLVNILNIFNAKYLLSGQKLPLPGFHEIVNGGGLYIYENISSFPRYFLADKVLLTDDSEKALLQQFGERPFDRTTVIVENETWGKRTLIQSGTDSAAIDSVEVLVYDPFKGYSKLSVRSRQEQVLVALENYAPGWRATIDRKQTDIFPVNYYAKGIVVPKGVSIVELEYRSDVALLWRKVTLISALIFFLFIIFVTIRSVVVRQKT